MMRKRWLLDYLCVTFAVLPMAGAASDDVFKSTVQPFLQQHCLKCHGPEKQEARIRYDQLQTFAIEDRHLWTMVHEMLASGEMPPDDQPQPAKATRDAVLTWIEQQQRDLGTGSTRRLNRRELSAALQDITGLAVDYTAGLPGDGELDGFDTGAVALQDAAASVDQVMQVTRRAVDGIRFLDTSPAKVFEADLVDVKDARKALDPWKDQGAAPKTRGLSVPGVGLHLETMWLGDRGGLEIKIPVPDDQRGLIRLTLVVAKQKYFDGVPNPHLWVTIGGRVFDYREVTGLLDAPQRLEYVAQLEDLGVNGDGVKIELSTKVEVPFAVKGFENENKAKDPIPGGQSVFRPMYNRKERSPEKQPVPFIVLRSIRVESDFMATWPPRSWRVDAGEIRDDQQTAEKLLALWSERAWRRPARTGELDRFLSLFQQLRSREFSFDDALRAVFQSVLLTPAFRYLPATADEDEPIAQHAIAARLSFLFWGAPPDEELRRLAQQGKLRDAQVLGQQVDRLLSDPRRDAFVRPFVTQWLELDQPITIVQDHLEKQDFRFGRHLKESMKEETIAYVTRMIAQNRPARELVDSDWTMMNQSLAVHYGYEGIDGAELRAVKLRQDDPRGGGILSHAGIQSMLCWMGDNWVIYRGAWALRHILDDPPPPPPLDVPELDPSDGGNRGKTFKELLQQHQEHSKCAVCHKDMDPLGFAFQNFDVSGRWRAQEYESYAWGGLDGKKVWNGKGPSRPVDAAGRLPRGEVFTSYAEFKSQLTQYYVPDLTRGLLKSLMLYATGRKPDVDDMREIRALMKQYESQGYPVRDLLKGVVTSEAFLKH